jgi:hypothetical protein
MEKEGNHFPPNNKSVQEPEGNEENRYSDPHSNKTKINYAKEPHKNNLKEEILKVITENIMEILLDTWSTKTYRRHSRNSKTTKTKNMRKHKNK